MRASLVLSLSHCSVVDMSHNRLEDTAVYDVFVAMEKLVRIV